MLKSLGLKQDNPKHPQAPQTRNKQTKNKNKSRKVVLKPEHQNQKKVSLILDA